MVWQRLRKCVFLVCLSLIMCAALSATAHASSHTAYNDGNIGSTQLQIFRDIVNGLNINDNYVACRTGQYDYTLYAGDIKNVGSLFTGATAGTSIVSYNINTDRNNSSSYVYTVNTENNFSLNANDFIVYSNLGDYPSLEERSVIYEFSSLVILAVIALCALLRPLFSFVYRTRSK